MKNLESTSENKAKPRLANRCSFVPYGEVENRCVKCNYITWADKKKTHDEIVEDMVNAGYDRPNCYNVRERQST